MVRMEAHETGRSLAVGSFRIASLSIGIKNSFFCIDTNQPTLTLSLLSIALELVAYLSFHKPTNLRLYLASLSVLLRHWLL